MVRNVKYCNHVYHFCQLTALLPFCERLVACCLFVSSHKPRIIRVAQALLTQVTSNIQTHLYGHTPGTRGRVIRVRRVFVLTTTGIIIGTTTTITTTTTTTTPPPPTTTTTRTRTRTTTPTPPPTTTTTIATTTTITTITTVVWDC